MCISAKENKKNTKNNYFVKRNQLLKISEYCATQWLLQGVQS